MKEGAAPTGGSQAAYSLSRPMPVPVRMNQNNLLQHRS